MGCNFSSISRYHPDYDCKNVSGFVYNGQYEYEGSKVPSYNGPISVVPRKPVICTRTNIQYIQLHILNIDKCMQVLTQAMSLVLDYSISNVHTGVFNDRKYCVKNKCCLDVYHANIFTLHWSGCINTCGKTQCRYGGISLCCFIAWRELRGLRNWCHLETLYYLAVLSHFTLWLTCSTKVDKF